MDLRSLLSKINVLDGTHIQLEPLSEQHHQGLCSAADHEQIWQYMPYKATKQFFTPWFDECLEKMHSGEQITYAVREKTSQVVVGATAYYDIQLEHRRLSLGYSWYSPSVWGGTINPEAKLLMLMQAFEQWPIHRVEIGTDSRNQYSYNAIKKLGATEEGLLRQHMILHGHIITDTIVFSILASEWPDVKMRLMKRL